MTVAVVVAVAVLVVGVLIARDQFRHPEYWDRGAQEPEHGTPMIVIEIGPTTVHHHHPQEHHHHPAPELLTGEVVEDDTTRRLPPPDRRLLP